MNTEKRQHRETNEILQAIKKFHDEFCSLDGNLEIHLNLEVMKLWLMACQNQEKLLELKLKCNKQINILFHRHRFAAAEGFENLLLLISEKSKKEKEKTRITKLLLRLLQLKKIFKKLLKASNSLVYFFSLLKNLR